MLPYLYPSFGTIGVRKCSFFLCKNQQPILGINSIHGYYLTVIHCWQQLVYSKEDHMKKIALKT